jgi:UDP-N-acetylmuramate dehydrogenase
MVSTKHANFVVNYNKATAKDIYDVIHDVQKKVYDRFGIKLELEVKLMGFSNEDNKKVESSPDEAKV